MNVLVMAAGSVGGYFGGLLTRAGNDVLFVARGENLAAIENRGLIVESVTTGDFSVDARAVERPGGSWTADLVLFCVKSYHNDVAIETISPAVGPLTTILTLQNGIGSGDELSAAFGPQRVMLGAAYVEAAHPGPGLFQELGGQCRIVFAEQDGSPSPHGGKIQQAFADAGIDSEIAEDIEQALWNKLVYICGLSGMTCITHSSFAEVMDSPETRAMTLGVLCEATAVGKAAGVNLAPDLAETTMEVFVEEGDHLISSMHADLTAGRPMEFGNLNGKVSELGHQLGVPTPINDFITACLIPQHKHALAGV
jgi:2-dehydropantoate 2-reductase